MQQKFRAKLPIAIQPECFFIFAIMLMILPMRWLFGWFLAIIVHEFCHYLVISMFRIPITRIAVCGNGVIMETGFMTNQQELFSVLAGPLGGLSLIILARWLPYTAICGFIQAIYNLLPIYPMDGGRVLRCLCLWLFPESYALRIHNAMENGILWFIVGIGVYLTVVRNFGLLPLAFALFLLIRGKRIKISCKRSGQRVQ